jgi:hypothetical protein
LSAKTVAQNPGGERDAGIVTGAGIRLRALRTRLRESGLDEREGDSKQ